MVTKLNLPNARSLCHLGNEEEIYVFCLCTNHATQCQDIIAQRLLVSDIVIVMGPVDICICIYFEL